MTEIPHLRRLLQSLDVADEAPPAFADELWDELDAAYDAAATTPLDPAPDEIEIVVELDPGPARGRWGGRGLVAAAVAAGVIAVALAGVRWLPDRGDESAVPATSIAEACAQYWATEPSIAELIAALESDEAVAVDDVRAAADALGQLREDLEANGETRDELTRYADAAVLLSQAEIEVERGLLSQAGRTLASAQLELEFSSSTDGVPDPAPCPAP